MEGTNRQTCVSLHYSFHTSIPLYFLKCQPLIVYCSVVAGDLRLCDCMTCDLRLCPRSLLGTRGGPLILTVRTDSLWVEWVWLHSAVVMGRVLPTAVDTLHQPRNTATIIYQCLSNVWWYDGAPWSPASSDTEITVLQGITPYLPICDVAMWLLGNHIAWTTKSLLAISYT